MARNLTIQDIIDKAGGPDAIARRSKFKASRWAVYKWPNNGVPDQHWPLLIEMAEVTADELLAANVKARTAAAKQGAAA